MIKSLFGAIDLRSLFTAFVQIKEIGSLFKQQFINISIMENRNANNFNMGRAQKLATNISQKNDYRSPKFFRRKQGNHCDGNIGPEKTCQNQQDNKGIMCYISPRKILQSQSMASCSNKSIESQTSIKKVLENSSKDVTEFEQKFLTRMNKESQIVSKPTVKKLVINQKSLGEQNMELKELYNNLKNQLERQKDSNKRLTEENQYLYQKIEEFRAIIKQKKGQVSSLNQAIQHSHEKINQYKEALKNERENVSNLQMIIETVNKSNLESSLRSICQNTESTESQDKECQIEFYKGKLAELNQKLKYSAIYEGMNKKIKNDYHEELQKNKKLTKINHKLEAKVQSLLKQLDNKHQFYMGALKKNRNYQQFLFQLSPEK